MPGTSSSNLLDGTGRTERAIEGRQRQIDEPQPSHVRIRIVSQTDDGILSVPFNMLLFALRGRHLAIVVFDPLPQLLSILPPLIPELNAPQLPFQKAVIDFGKRHPVQGERFAGILKYLHVLQLIRNPCILRMPQGRVLGTGSSPEISVESVRFVRDSGCPGGRRPQCEQQEDQRAAARSAPAHRGPRPYALRPAAARRLRQPTCSSVPHRPWCQTAE